MRLLTPVFVSTNSVDYETAGTFAKPVHHPRNKSLLRRYERREFSQFRTSRFPTLRISAMSASQFLENCHRSVTVALAEALRIHGIFLSYRDYLGREENTLTGTNRA